MKKLLAAMVLALTFLINVFPASAQENSEPEEYFIELGKEASKEEAIAQWREFADRYGHLISDLQFYPKTAMISKKQSVTRIVAGPIPSKKEAQKICKKLFKDNTPCFVIEGMTKEQAAAQPKKKPVLPWLEKDDSENSGGFLPWLGGNNGSKEAKVEVAEAIRVPLSESKQSGETLPLIKASGPVIFSDEAPAQPAISAQEAEKIEDIKDVSREAGWLNIEAFADEGKAMSFWQNIRATTPNLAAGLRVRIVKPFMASDQPVVSLNIGPFPNAATAQSFCRNTVEVINPALVCRFDQGQPGRREIQTRQPGSRSNEYNRRRGLQESGGERSMLDSAQPQPKRYWLQLVTGTDQMDALAEWKRIKAENADLLSGLNSRISTSLLGGEYTVRVGPIDSSETAMKLCGALKTRNIPCKTYSNM